MHTLTVSAKIKRNKRASPKGNPDWEFSPTPGRPAQIYNSPGSYNAKGAASSGTSRESSIHLPLKEYEVPDFLKDTSRKHCDDTSPVLKRNLKDPDFASVAGQGSIISKEELVVPEFLRHTDTKNVRSDGAARNAATLSTNSVSSQVHTTTKKQIGPDRQRHPKVPSATIKTVGIESNGNNDFCRTIRQQGVHSYSLEIQTEGLNPKGVGKQHLKSKSSQSVYPLPQKKLDRRFANSMEKMVLTRMQHPGNTSSKTSSDTESDIRLHSSVVVDDIEVGGDAASYEDFSLKRKYKKGATKGRPRRQGDRNNLEHMQRLGPARLQVEPGGRRKSHNWPADTDSLQSTSSQSLTEPVSTSEKDKFSISVRDHGNLVLLGKAASKIQPPFLQLTRDSNCFDTEDHDSLPYTQQTDALNGSLGYNESSPDEGRKVKRKDSLQAHLRNRIGRIERMKHQSGARPQYDHDSTIISDHSAFEDILPRFYRRKSGTGLHTLNDLPEDILILILSYLPTKDLCVASGVCQRWQTLCWDPVLWTNISITNYQDSDINKVLCNVLSKLAVSTQGYCITIRSIKLSGCELLADKGLGFIARFCIDLEELDVSSCCCITSKGLQDVLLNCHNLYHLDTSGCTCVNSLSSPVSNGFGQPGTFLQLRNLDLSDCVAFDDLGLRVVALSCSLLENLYIRRCNRITDVGMKHIAYHCSQLKELSISDCYKVRDFGVKEIAKHAANLKYLSASKCPVTDTAMKYVGKNCAKLKYLNIRGCEAVSDVGITHIVQNCLKLRSLDVGKCDITDSGLHTIGIHCPQLKKLSIRGCDNVTDTGVRTVAAQCCSLQYLNLQECNLTYDSFLYIRKHCRNCIIEHTCPAFF